MSQEYLAQNHPMAALRVEWRSEAPPEVAAVLERLSAAIVGESMPAWASPQLQDLVREVRAFGCLADAWRPGADTENPFFLVGRYAVRMLIAHQRGSNMAEREVAALLRDGRTG